MAGTAFSRARSFTRRLSVQLTALLTLALFPLGLISLYQTNEVIEEARELNRASLMERTVAAGSRERDLIKRALGAAQGIGLAVESLPVEECVRVMTRLTRVDEAYLSARFHDRDGRLVCQSAGADMAAALGVTFSDGAEEIAIRPAGAERGVPVIRVSHPVSGPSGPTGFVSVSIPLSLANELIAIDGPADGLRIVVLNRAGEVLAASHRDEDPAEWLPASIGPGSLADLDGVTFDREANNGETRVFAVASMIEGETVLVGSWPQRASLGTAWGPATIGPMVLPALMWITGMFVAFFGLQRLVIRHVSALRSAMRRFALGELHGGRLELDNPPEELRETERAFNRMVLLLAQAEAQQEQDLRDKEVLLREVHHRVKNNLQLIGSIMNMQARAARTPETRRVLDSLRTRVRGLATVHRTLYTTPTMTTVGAAELVRTLVSDITSITETSDMDVETRLDDADLYPDQAVPLSMLLSETLTNAVKYLGRGEGGRPFIHVDLAVEGQTVTLSIANSVDVAPPEDTERDDDVGGDQLGTRLIRAFEQQIGGRAETVREDGVYTYRMVFSRHDFDADNAA